MSGGSSSTTPPQFDNSHFLSAKNEQLYWDRIGNSVLVEVDLGANFNNVHHVCDLFAEFGCSQMLDLPIDYYPGLVHQFYANIKHKDKLRGECITLTRQFLSDFLGAKNDGPPFEHGKTTITYDSNRVFEITL